MALEKSTLSNNIKLLRKAQGLSQEAFAEKLNIKRSNIAAYESKNVEPRLRIILEMARIFDIDVSTLIDTDLNENSDYKKFQKHAEDKLNTDLNLDLTENEQVESFVKKSEKIRKVLEGFKAFYNFRKNGIVVDSPEKEKIIFDIDNFIQLMEHLLSYNENVITTVLEISKSEPG